MTDKQQIEKFATDLCKACRKSLKTCECKTPCVKTQIVSEALYNAGYRKVPENAVLLTREEHKQMFKDLIASNKVIEAETRKETAKEIIATVKSCMQDFEDDDDGYILKKCEFEFFMRELAKQLGVGVEE